MIDLGVDVASILPWFQREQEFPFVLIRVSAEHASHWADVLYPALRRCYVADDALEQNAQRTGRPKTELLAASFPDPGSTMAGDFGEILVYLYHAAQQYPAAIIGPKKWRLKQDRTKPAPYSDVIHLIVPSWPQATENDSLLCSEVKTKSTNGGSSPITAAIADCEKDRTSRLAKTLVWLRERALGEDLGSITIAHLDRFINATDYPPAKKNFQAVAVICSSLTNNELLDAPEETPSNCTVVVISVPDLKQLYEAVFNAARATVTETGGAT
jgi:hypothetical protein